MKQWSLYSEGRRQVSWSGWWWESQAERGQGQILPQTNWHHAFGMTMPVHQTATLCTRLPEKTAISPGTKAVKCGSDQTDTICHKDALVPSRPSRTQTSICLAPTVSAGSYSLHPAEMHLPITLRNQEKKIVRIRKKLKAQFSWNRLEPLMHNIKLLFYYNLELKFKWSQICSWWRIRKWKSPSRCFLETSKCWWSL